MQIRTFRAGEGLETDIAREVFERYKAGEDFTESIKAAMVQLAIDRYRPKIEAAMRRAGISVEPGEDLTAETILAALREKTGLDLDDLTPDSVARALDESMARELSNALGVEVSTVLDPETLKQELIDGAIEAVKSGRVNALVTRRMIDKVRTVATWARAGVPMSERSQIMGAWYQKKYRRTHKQVWD